METSAGSGAGGGSEEVELRRRALSELQAGKTVTLRAEDLANAQVRERLPDLLREVQAEVPPESGPVVPGHDILGELGSGGMSTVYLARNHQLGRSVALKVLPRWLAGDPAARERFLREARALARLDHPSIVKVHDVLDLGDQLVLSMEWVDGVTLRQLLQSLSPRPEPRDLEVIARVLGRPVAQREALQFLLGVFMDVANALQTVHEAGFLHRDVKASNILIRRDGSAKLADFGVAAELDGDRSATGDFAGTPLYAAPEQLRREKGALGPATDVYGLGITLYEALARRLPYADEGIVAHLARIEAGRIPRLGRQVDVSKDLETIVHKAIDPDPARRYQSAHDLAEDLRAFLEYRPIAARPLAAHERIQRWIRREPWKAALVGVLVLLVPGLAALAGTLIAEQPRITAQREVELRTQARDLQQQGFQELFYFSEDPKLALPLFRQALELLPDGPVGVTCFATALSLLQPADAVVFLDSKHLLVSRYEGLRRLRAKAARSHRFLQREEAQQLQSSRDRVDLLVCAIDGLLRAQEIDAPGAFRPLLPVFQSINLGDREADPLFYGLHARAAAGARDVKELERVLWAMHTIWPDAPETLMWESISWAPLDIDRAVKSSMLLVERQPQSAKAVQILAHHLDFAERSQEAMAAIEAGLARGLKEAELLRAKGRVLGSMEAFERFEAEVLPGMSQESLSDLLYLAGTYAKRDPSRAETWIRKGLETARGGDRAEFLELLGASLRAETGREEECLAAWAEAHELRPENSFIRSNYAIGLMLRGDVDAARVHFDTLRARDHWLPGIHPLMVSCYLQARDHVSMLDIADRWMQVSGQESRASHYRGIALSRLGRFREAMQAFDRHLDEAGRPYVECWVERAWLRVDPGGDQSLRDPVAAATEIERALATARARRREPTPWMLCVSAEVAFANGDRERAIRDAEQALRTTQLEQAEGPAEMAAMLRASLSRYRN